MTTAAGVNIESDIHAVARYYNITLEAATGMTTPVSPSYQIF